MTTPKPSWTMLEAGFRLRLTNRIGDVLYWMRVTMTRDTDEEDTLSNMMSMYLTNTNLISKRTICATKLN